MAPKDKVRLSDGAGGELMQRMLARDVLPLLRREGPSEGTELVPSMLDDSASVGDMAFTIDGYTVWPLEFPGGDIGRIAVDGTVNDLSVVGAVPRALAVAYIIEEGLDVELLRRVSRSIGEASAEAGVEVVTGDTKVVEKGGVRGMFVTSAGIGNRSPRLDANLERARALRTAAGSPWTETRWVRDDLVRPGDTIVLTGSVGDHGIALYSFREGYGFATDIVSDVAPLNGLMDRALSIGGVVAAKDLTRGGLSNALNEWSQKSRCQIMIDESTVPVKGPVRSATDLLGLDPYEIGNEGKAIIAVAPGAGEEVLEAVRRDRYGKDAVIIGSAIPGPPRVVLKTVVGGKRIMDPPHGDPIPRIC